MVLITTHWKDDFARKTFGAPVEAEVALVLVFNHPLHYADAEALMGGLLDCRTGILDPSENKLAVRLLRSHSSPPASAA